MPVDESSSVQPAAELAHEVYDASPPALTAQPAAPEQRPEPAGPPLFVTSPIAITKDALAGLYGFRQASNEHPIVIDGREWAAGSMIFVGFKGRLMLEDRLYHGVLRFSAPSPDQPYAARDFAELAAILRGDA